MKSKNQKLFLVLLSLGLIALTIAFLVTAERELTQTEREWVTYQNEELNFEIKHPADWTVFEDLEDEINPRVNFYPEDLEPAHPVTHHSEISNVSVFPQGIPTSGVFGEFQDSAVSFAFRFDEAIDFTLSNGSVWATFAGVESFPSPNWNQSGFIWARADIQDLELRCFREEEISMEECDPYTGDLVVRDGFVDVEERIIQREILRSFRPIE